MGCGRHSSLPVLVLALVLAVLAAILSTQDMRAASASADVAQTGPNFVVNTLDNVKDGVCGTAHCSLRDAIVAANANADSSTITFSVSGTITLDVDDTAGNGLPVVSTSIIVNGGGNITLNGNNARRIMFVNSSGVAQLNGLTLTTGRADNGAAVYSQAGNVTISGSTIANNSATGIGGGVVNESGTLSIGNSTISGNSAATGGGIYSFNSNVTVTNSTISGNNATGDGGGIVASGSFNFVTITNNHAGSVGTGGGLFGNATVRNSLITGNSANATTNSDDCYGTITWSGSNLVGSSGANRGCSGASNTLAGVSSTALSPTLANNGGSTQTHLLVSGSIAQELVASGQCGTIASPTTTLTPDQRGTARPQFTTCDVGAVESLLTPDPVQSGPTLVVNTTNDNNGQCTALDCSLREAITLANSTTSTDETITFNIHNTVFGAAPHVINVTGTTLPAISDTVTIDGLTEPDIVGGTCPIGSATNDNLAIQINDPGSLLFGLLLSSNAVGSSIRGLSITNFGDAGGIHLQASGTITCNYIGVAADGTTSGGNDYGIIGANTSNVTIGGPNPGDGNVIAHSATDGIYLSAVSNSVMQSNTIRNNGTNGVHIFAGVGDRISQNAIYSNGSAAGDLGIDLGGNGVTQNDTGDGDTGINNLQNFPVLNGVAASGAVTGSLDSLVTSTAYPVRIEFFANTACDSSGYGEGEVYLGATSVAAPGTFSATLTLVSGKNDITATAIDANGNTSEFSACRTADFTLPGVTITSTAPDPTNVSPIPVTVQFSETVFNFAAIDIAIGNGTVNNFTAVDGDTYTFDLVPAGQGLVTADIAAGRAQDAGGNDNTAADQFSRTYDSVAPTVTVNQAGGQADPTTGSPIGFTVVFSQAVTGFGDSVADVTLSGTAGATTATITPVSTTTYTVTVSGMATGGTVIVTIPAGAAQDLATNPSAASTSTDNTVTFQPGTQIDNVSGETTYGDTTATLTARLRSLGTGAPVAGQRIVFTVGGQAVCGGATGRTCPTTGADGVATLTGVPVAGRNAGNYANLACARYDGGSYQASGPTCGPLRVARRILWVKPTDRTVGLKQPNPPTTPPANCLASQTPTSACWLQLTNGSSFVNGDDWGDLNLANLRFAYSRSGTGPANERVGTQYRITALGALSTNYDLRYQTGTLTVIAP